MHRTPRTLSPAALAASLLTAHLATLVAERATAQPERVVDLAGMTTSGGSLLRVAGHTGDGTSGLPVAGGHDCDGDSLPDLAFAAFRASPLERNGAGEVYLVFGDGSVGGTLDTAVPQERILEILGDEDLEAAGSEIWMDDVTGDGLGDLLILRQNYTVGGARPGAGALTVVVGSPALRTRAASLQPLDLRAPGAGVTLLTLVGAHDGDRLGIWARTGDVTGDGIADFAVGADQQDFGGQAHNGSVYVVRGGSHLAANLTVDLASLGSTPLAGHLALILPPPGANEFHLGGTVQVADLDGNGRAEVLLAATLARAGAALPPANPTSPTHSAGGTLDGTLYIAWDDNFPAGTWPAGYTFSIQSPPGSRTEIDGAPSNLRFGEELLGGLDYDDDGTADLFVEDLLGDGTSPASRPSSGLGHVFYDAASLKGLTFDLGTPPPGLVITTFLGPVSGAIGADTAAHGDFDGDGIADLAFSSPHADPAGRMNAGMVHVIHGRSGPWPAEVDLAPGAVPPTSQARIAEIWGAEGGVFGDVGDTLCYSAAAGDFDGDGLLDLVTNEMAGNGLTPGAVDVGNLIVVSGKVLVDHIFTDGFESGDTSAWTLEVADGASKARSILHALSAEQGRTR